MVSLKSGLVSKRKRFTATSPSHPKRQWLGRTPAPRANKQETVTNAVLPRLLSTLRISTFSKLSMPRGTPSGTPQDMRIIRVSELKFDAVGKPPVVISGPTRTSFCDRTAKMWPVDSYIVDTAIHPTIRSGTPLAQDPTALVALRARQHRVAFGPAIAHLVHAGCTRLRSPSSDRVVLPIASAIAVVARLCSS